MKHPLPIGTKVVASQKTCNCSGGKVKEVEGTVLKVITNHSGTWYYLSTGGTVKADQVVRIV